jgi:hypothetical protein
MVSHLSEHFLPLCLWQSLKTAILSDPCPAAEVGAPPQGWLQIHSYFPAGGIQQAVQESLLTLRNFPFSST